MGVFGAVFGSRGGAGFSGALLGVSSGVVGFNVAMFRRPVHEIFRPARPDVGASAKKFAQYTKNGQKWVFYGALGEFFAEMRLKGPCGASYFADQQSWDPAGRVCCAVCLAAGPGYWHP